ncbi:MAG TPA: hypothetical protein VLI90_08210, partial [Tepidisphaeraceae bacterium]|nr:hypothetical protein [Tepidisphaeraceae bacterium]
DFPRRSPPFGHLLQPWCRDCKNAYGRAKKAELSPVARAKRTDAMVRNVIFNVEQNPAAHTVEEVIRNLRDALGLKEGERP